MKRIIAAIIIVLVSVMLLSGCSKYVYFGGLGCCVPSEEWRHWMEDQKSCDKEKAASIAQSYLEEKYDEKFTCFLKSTPANPYPEDLVVICHFIRKDDEKVEEPMKYRVEVVYKSGEYTVVRDNYMFVYIRKVAEDFLRPYVEKRFSDIEFVFFLYRAGYRYGALDDEYRADAKIPQSFDELYDVTSGIYFQICVPISEDQDKVSEICSLLKNDLKKLDTELEIDVFIEVYQNDRFAEISQSSDPRREVFY